MSMAAALPAWPGSHARRCTNARVRPCLRHGSAPLRPTAAAATMRPMASENDVREIALSLPETVERPSYGTPGFRVKDKLFARLREPGVLLVRVADEGEKDFLLRAEPDKFFTTPHYDGHSSVLVRLAAVDREKLAELLADAWRVRAPKRLADALDP